MATDLDEQTSFTFDKYGNVIKFKRPEEYEFDIFRKPIDITEYNEMTELKICQILYERADSTQLKNIVKIYKVVDTGSGDAYIDMELLIPLENIDGFPQLTKLGIAASLCKEQIKDGLDQLHALGIVYIDVKLDNIGWSMKDQVCKIFDFNYSGILIRKDPRNWDRAPQQGFIFTDIKEKYEIKNLIDIDNYALKEHLGI